MKGQSKFKLGVVFYSWKWTSIVTILVPVILILCPGASTQTTGICDTKYSERDSKSPKTDHRNNYYYCESTQPINWMIQQLYASPTFRENKMELPFKIETKLVSCDLWEIPPAAANSDSTTATRKIPYYFTSNFTWTKPNRGHSSNRDVELNVAIFCGTFATGENLKRLPWARLEFKNGHLKVTERGFPPKTLIQAECDDSSAGLSSRIRTCPCDSSRPVHCENLVECRFLAHSHACFICSACRLRRVTSVCNATPLSLSDSDSDSISGGFLRCESIKSDSYIPFFPTSQTLRTTHQMDRNLAPIQILGNETENYQNVLELFIQSPENEREITRKHEIVIECRGPAFLFLEGFLWNVEFKDNETNSDSFPKFTISAPKTEEILTNAGKYVSSTLKILPDDRNTSVAVNVTCQAFVNDRPFFVQSNLTFKLDVYRPKLTSLITCVNGSVSIFYCHAAPNEDRYASTTWHNASGHELEKHPNDDVGTKYWHTCSENITCTATWWNGVKNSHTITTDDCEKRAREKSCTETLQKENPTTTTTEQPTTTTKITTTIPTTPKTTQITTTPKTTQITTTPKTTQITTTPKTTQITTTPKTTQITTTPKKTSITTTTPETKTTRKTTTIPTTPKTTTIPTTITTPMPSRTTTIISSTLSTSHPNQSKDVIIFAISGGFGLCLLIFIPCVLILILKNRKQRERLKISDDDINDFMRGTDSVHFIPYDTSLEIPKDKITIGARLLGSGAFGKVIEGQMGERRVAVKTVNKSADIQYFKALLSEIKIMGFVGKHENVVELVGACTWDIKNRNAYVVFELCENGNLIQYLRKNRANFENQLQQPSGAKNVTERMSMSQRCSMLISSKMTRANSQKKQSLKQRKMTTHDLVRWSSEIASGMDVIAQKNIYHGDLAARNILLDGNFVAKVGDFGLSRQLCDYSVYVQKIECPLPLKWMSIESLRDLEFSIQSDVWSYGVTLWEIFSLGFPPYPNCPEWNFASWKILMDGERMGKPEQASNSIYEIMLKCWNEKPTDRPTFAQLKIMFQDECKNMKKGVPKTRVDVIEE